MKHYVGICLVLVTLAAIFLFALHSCTETVNGEIDHVRDAFIQVFRVQPQITVNQRVVLSQTAPIAELAVVTKEEQVSVGLDAHLEVLSIQIPLTEKTLTAEATYRIKSGFDLAQPFTVEIDPKTHELNATLPHAKILSVEQVGDLSLHGEDATLNRVTDEERTQIVDALNSAARNAADASGLKEDAEKQATDRLREILAHDGQPYALKWDDETSIVPKMP